MVRADTLFLLQATETIRGIWLMCDLSQNRQFIKMIATFQPVYATRGYQGALRVEIMVHVHSHKLLKTNWIFLLPKIRKSALQSHFCLTDCQDTKD